MLNKLKNYKAKYIDRMKKFLALWLWVGALTLPLNNLFGQIPDEFYKK